MKFIAALRFLTVIPLPFRRQPTPEEFGGALYYFPAVGLIIGLLLAILYYILQFVLPPTTAIVIVIAAMVLIHGALHVDGFIDTCDGLAGNKPAEERWKIMKDSRVGAFGVIGAVLLFLIKFAALISLPRNLILPALVLMPLLSRWSIVYAVMAYPYARPSGLGTTFKQYARWSGFVPVTLGTLAAAIIVLWCRSIPYPYAAALGTACGVWLITLAGTKYLNRKFAGLTGDSYGAINEIAEVGTVLVFLLLAYNRWLWMS